MQLELAENNSNFPYVFVPLRESGIFVHEEKLSEMLSKKGKGKKAAKKIGLAPGRNAYLALVKLNFMGFATKLQKAIAANESGVKKLWEQSLGGNFNKLKTAVSVGAKKKALGEFQPLALEPTTTAAAATATPVIVSILNWMKKNIPAIVDNAKEIIDILPKKNGQLPPDPADPANADQYEKESHKDNALGIPTPYLIGGALLAAYFMFNKEITTHG